MLEELLMKHLEITKRIGYREKEKNILIPIDLKLRTDKAYVRSVFKRKLLSSNPKEIILINDKMEQTKINLSTTFINPINLKSNEDREKILNTISNWINTENKLGHMPHNIKLN
jgi:hypothetical protein